MIVFDGHQDLEKYVADEFLDLEETYTLYLTEKFLDELIEIDNKEKKAYCKCKIKATGAKIDSLEKEVAQYKRILRSLR